MRERLVKHVAAICGCAAATVWWLWPLGARFADAVPGAAPGDNLTFIWNVWWTRVAVLDPNLTLLFTPLLFHPFGTDLTLHTHTLLPALVVSGIANPVAAQNVLIGVHLFLNFVCAYVLAYRETRHAAGSIAAAVVFGWSPYVCAHLEGHFNLIAAWVLPLTALVVLSVRDAPSLWRGVLLGVVLGGSAYVDYYYFIYATLLCALLMSGTAMRFRWTAPAHSAWVMVAARVFVALLVIDGLLVGWILIVGGSRIDVAGIRISARSLANPIAAAWLLTLTWLAIHAVRRLRLTFAWPALRPRLRPLLLGGLTTLVILTPIVVRGWMLWHAGEYTSQRYLWRSAPAGVDLASFVLGNPFSLLYGGASASLYERLGVNLVEDVAWLGPAAIVLCAIAIRRGGTAVWAWVAAGVLFGIWSLGPYVHVAGHGTTLWLPALLVRWIPIVANARVPSRAIVLVYLSVAVLTAYAFAALTRSRPARTLTMLLATLLLLDYLPHRPALRTLDVPQGYALLAADKTPGAVCELPLGLRDGFGEIGRFDPRILFFQTRHHRPLLGGFVARLPRSLVQRYRDLPIVGTLLRLSSGEKPGDDATSIERRQAAAVLASLGIRYVVLNRAAASPDLVAYVRDVLPLRQVAADGDRVFYIVDSAVVPSMARATGL